MRFCRESTRHSETSFSDLSAATGPLLPRWRTKFQKFVKSLTGIHSREDWELPVLGLDVRISPEIFCDVLADPKVDRLLDSLDICVADPMLLFDAFDADGSGSVDVAELLQGLMRMRGTAEKSDIVACLLSVRAVQKRLGELDSKWMQSHKLLRMSQRKMDSRVKHLEKQLKGALFRVSNGATPLTSSGLR